jgi:hypothetical protein
MFYSRSGVTFYVAEGENNETDYSALGLLIALSSNSFTVSNHPWLAPEQDWLGKEPADENTKPLVGDHQAPSPFACSMTFDSMQNPSEPGATQPGINCMRPPCSGSVLAAAY